MLLVFTKLCQCIYSNFLDLRHAADACKNSADKTVIEESSSGHFMLQAVNKRALLFLQDFVSPPRPTRQRLAILSLSLKTVNLLTCLFDKSLILGELTRMWVYFPQ